MNSGVIEIEKRVVGNNSSFRKKILDFESKLGKADGAVFGNNYLCPLKHTFADGIYIREMFHPKGLAVVGKIHKQTHASFIMSGEVTVATETGEERIKAPYYFISPAGTKRAVYAHEDTVWITIHHNPDNLTDISELEDTLVANDYSEYEKHIEEGREGKNYLNGENEALINCGLAALKNLSDLKKISMRTLMDMADDNKIKLYPYQISLDELNSIPLPAIVHSENHFDYIYKKEDFNNNVKYTGSILLTKEADYPKIDTAKQKEITGESFVSVAAFGLYAAVATAGGAIASSGVKARQSKKAAAAAHKAQLINDAVAARKAQEEAKVHKRNAETMMIAAGALLLIGVGLTVFLVINHKAKSQLTT